MKNKGLGKYSKQFLMTLTVNVVSLILNTLLILFLPKILSDLSYGYWQFYQMLALYIGYATLGITDGAYVRYGGKEYDTLPMESLRSQFWLLLVFHLLINVLIFLVLGGTGLESHERFFAFVMMGISGFLYVPKTLITFTLQATSRIRDYAKITIIEKIIVMIVIIVLVALGISDFRAYVTADVFGKLISLAFGLILYPDFLIGKAPKLITFRRETTLNFKLGIQILIANLSSLLINGVVRIFIERKWGIITFGKISFSFSVTNIITVLILAISIVFFPMLKRQKRDSYGEIYQLMRCVLPAFIATLLLFYFPMEKILHIWLPSFSESIRFLAILFPTAIFECNVKLISNNFFKALRKETFLMYSNIGSVLIALILACLGSFVFDNLIVTVSVMVIVQFLRTAVSDLYLMRLLGVNALRNLVLDIVLALSFILCAWFLPEWWGFLGYFIVYAIIIFVQRKELVQHIELLRVLI
jgi:O-antigen/teichoic acid export membrane protein